MTRAGRISVSVAVALTAGIAAQLGLNAALGHRPPSGSAMIFFAYLLGGLPGLLLDPILLLIEGVIFAIIYNLLPKPPAND
jgi:hypothetical protein